MTTTKRKTVAAVDKEQDLTELAVKQLIAMGVFMWTNPSWTPQDYLNDPQFDTTAMKELMGW